MASNRTFRCGFSVVSCPPRSTHTSPSASLAIGQALRVLQTAAPLSHWTLTAAPEKALAAAVAYNVVWIAVSTTSAPQRRQYPSWCPPTLVSASLSASVARSVARSRLLVWWWLAHGEVEGQLVRAAIGQVHPLAAMWAHQVGGPRTTAKGLDDLLLLSRHLFTLPAVFDRHTLRRLALDDLPDHVGRHAAQHGRG
jgi:hypothetical protein